jgi:UDP-N-acetylglucosamine 3-dehydrogenase
MKILLIGVGNMGKNHKRILKELQEKYKYEFKTCDTNGEEDYTNFRDAIRKFEPTHVVVATPTNTHGEILDFLDGKVESILVEKPIVGDNSESEYYATRSKIMVGHVERFNPMVTTIKSLLENKQFNTVICMRCGFPNGKDDYETDKDLCVHDTDVVQLLTRHLKEQFLVKNNGGVPLFNKIVGNNIADIFTEINGVTCFFHADKMSPHKVRTIQILGDKFIIEGDYIEQSVKLNNDKVPVKKSEPLRLEIEYFLDGSFNKEDLKEAINNLKILKGARLRY